MPRGVRKINPEDESGISEIRIPGTNIGFGADKYNWILFLHAPKGFSRRTGTQGEGESTTRYYYGTFASMIPRIQDLLMEESAEKATSFESFISMWKSTLDQFVAGINIPGVKLELEKFIDSTTRKKPNG